MLKLGYKELFCDLDFEEQYPIELFSKNIPKLIGNSRDPIYFDFSGIDQLSDEVFFVLKNELKDSQKENVEYINLTGCTHITDRGIELLAQTFINIRELFLVGCTEITELSLWFLNENCHKLINLSAQFTQISFVPKQIEERWGLDALGCTHLLREDNVQETKPLPVNLIIIAMDPDIKYDIGHFLTTGTIKKRDVTSPIIFQRNALIINDTDINIIQLFCPTSYMAPLINDRCLFMIAVDMASEISNAFNIIKGLDFIRGVVYAAPVQILALTTSSDKKKLDDLTYVLRSIFAEQSVNMKEHLDREHYSKTCNKDFIDQWRYVQSLSAVNSEHLSLSVIGLNTTEKECIMSFYNVICEPSSSGKIEQTIRDFALKFVNVKDSLERTNKNDIAEIKSFSKMPDYFEKIFKSILLILKKTNTNEISMKQIRDFLNDPLFLSPLLDYNILSEEDNPDKVINILTSIFHSKEELDKTSRGMKLSTSMGLWLLLKWNLCERLSPLKKKSKDFELLAEEIKEAKNSLQTISTSLRQNLIQLTSYMYGHRPGHLTSAMKTILEVIKRHNVPIIQVKDITTALPQMTKSYIHHVLQQLQSSGYLISFKNTGYVIIDLEWFINFINLLLTKWTEPINGNSVWFISSVVVMSAQEHLEKIVESICDTEMFKRIMTILRDYGLILSVSRSWNVDPKNYEPLLDVVYVPKTLIVSWHQLTIKPDSNSHLVANKDTSSPLQDTKILKRIFPDYTAHEFIKDDLSFKFSYKFRTGMPANLFCQVVNRLLGEFRTILLWNQGILVREGAVDVLISHNIHASRGSSSFDIESRILGPVNGRRPVAVREHMWSVLSDILITIEASILEYPHLHHKLRHYCRGQCYQEMGQENTFSQAEVSKHLNSNYFCTKCSEYQMSRSDWQYILGRQLILPNHEIDKYNIQSCKNCWRHRAFISKIWEFQINIFPSFCNILFGTSNKDFVQGNLIFSSNSPESVFSHMQCSSKFLRSVNIKVVDPINTSIKFITHSSPGDHTDLFCWKLDTGTVTTELTKVSDIQLSGDAQFPKPIIAGESLQFFFHDNVEDGSIFLTIAINHIFAAKYCLSMSMQARFCVAVESEEVKKLKLILSNIDAGVVTANHFRPGMIVLIKTETRWEPAVIVEILRGKLNCQPLSSLDENAVIITPVNNVNVSVRSPSILPPAFYPSDVNSTLNSKNQKALADSWYSILEHYSDYSPACFGLFPDLFKKKTYSPLPLFNQESRYCTTSCFAPCNILRMMFVNPKPTNSRSLTSYLPLPYPMTPEKLLMPQRQIISHYSDHSLNRLCPGTSWKNYLRDMHPMNEKPYRMSEGESKYFFSGDFALDNFLIIKNFSSSFSAIYQNIDQCMPFIDPDINRDLLRDAIVAISKVYRDILLFDIVSKIKNYDCLVISNDKSSNDVIKSIVKSKKTKKNNPTLKPSTEQKLSTDTMHISSSATWTEEEMTNIQDMLMKPQSVCNSHKMSLDVMIVSDLGSYNKCIANITIKGSEMENVQDTALVTCSNLRRLEIDFGVMTNTVWLQQLPKLTSLTLSNCNLKIIGDEFNSFQKTLKQLCLSGNPIECIPDFICDFEYLNSLELNNTLISRLPDNFGKLQYLRYLSIDHTKLNCLPQSFSQLKTLKMLRLSGIPPANLVNKRTGSIISMKGWMTFCKKTHINGCIYNEKESLQLFEQFVGVNNSLESSRNAEFESFLFRYFPRFTEFPTQIFECTNLQTLIMPNQGFTHVPDEIQKLVQLKKVAFDGCLYLQTLSGQLGTLPLEVLSCQNCDSLNTPPIEIRRQGMKNTIAYLLRLVSGSEACYRTKLMLVGLGGAGKTSLMRALMSKDFKAPHLSQESITDGIDIHTWSTKQEGGVTLQFSVWDFAGQTLYYNTHQFFLTGRSVYLLLWNVRQGFEHAGLDFWLNSITCHAPSAPIFIVGTHSDKVDRSEIPINAFKARYPSIVNFHFVSSLNGQGVEKLHDDIIEETKRQPYIGEIVPNAWLRLEKDLISQRSTSDYLTFDTVKKLATNNAIYDAEVYQAIRFLHDLGSIQYFETALLKSYIIINSQWLVDVMACVVSVKNTVIENGKLEHSKIKDVWPNYPATIHMWLLRLTEIFDLTFSVSGQNFNYVPCLLDSMQPEFDWPQFIAADDTKESNMFYKFDYLPPGLFNRAQVRLSQYSDSFIIWQNGSLLRKNNDKALMTKINDNVVMVSARGYWPDNILFIVHEVFETLISEAFTGVQYEYKLSCRKCIAERVPRPYLFSKKILQKAIQSKTVFIQCHTNFHIMTMSDIQESMPPEGLEDYDLQFKRSIRMISSTNEHFDNMIMVLVSVKDYQSTDSFLNMPKRIIKDLQNRQYHVWFEPLEEGKAQEHYIDMMTRAEVVITMMSGNFSKNKLCMTLFQLAKNTLRKNMSFLLLDRDYVKGDLGLEVVGQKYINFLRANVYDEKFQELLHDIETLSTNTPSKSVGYTKPRVFISYCWDNSQRAFDVGNSKTLNKEAIGWGDPRDIKDYLEQKGITCWLDVEQIGPNSLYTEIAAGLRDSEMIVACLSAEYAASETCRKEFMFGTQNLRLPVLIAIVGTGNAWSKTEIGLLTVEYPKISFQTPNDNAFEELYHQVDNTLTIHPKTAGRSESGMVSRSANDMASQEEFELIQRKIFRLLCSGFGNEESRMYPRLFFIDILDMSAKNDDSKESFHDFDMSMKNTLATAGISEFSLCFRMLCETEEGWHTVDEGLPILLNIEDQERLLTLAAPYLFRVTTLLKYSQSDNIKLFQSDPYKSLSDHLMELLAKNAKTWKYMKIIHNTIRTHIINKDVRLKYGGLKSCCLNSGKIVWLCRNHSNKSNISEIDSEESNSLIRSSRRMTSDCGFGYEESGADGDDQVIKDDLLLNELESINREQISDVESSTDSKKANNETNKMLDILKTDNLPEVTESMTNIANNDPVKVSSVINNRYVLSGQISNESPSEVQSRTNGTITDHVLVPSLELMPPKSQFVSKACLIM